MSHQSFPKMSVSKTTHPSPAQSPRHHSYSTRITFTPIPDPDVPSSVLRTTAIKQSSMSEPSDPLQAVQSYI